MSQLTFADIAIADKRKPSRISIKLEKINKIVNWEDILNIVRVVDSFAGSKQIIVKKVILPKRIGLIYRRGRISALHL